MGSVVSDPAGTDPVPDTWIVTAQDPKAGQKHPVGTLDQPDCAGPGDPDRLSLTNQWGVAPRRDTRNGARGSG